jgi:prepilin-type N-terminal cleavage/methylation domain-containing protein/prepilin-type processing-associated H-X9-DG protein
MKPRRTAFSLLELMVVVMVIGMLVAIVMPYLERVFALQRKVACANHLEKLGQAYGLQCAARKMEGFVGTGLGTVDWPRPLGLFVSNAAEVFHCPEDDGSSMGHKASLANYYMDVYPGGDYKGSVCLNEEEGDFVWKLSQTQWDTFRDMAARNGRQSHGYNHPGYVADDNPNLYYFAFEDMKWSSNPDRDFWDLNFKVDLQGVNITITIVHGETGYNHYLFLGPPEDPERQPLFDGKSLKTCEGQSHTIEGSQSSNYGMNSMAGKIEPGRGQKILIMDYEVLLVAGSPYDETSGGRAEQLETWWQGDPDDPKAPLSFARHLGKCNVLFTDGTVRLMGTEEVHPTYIEAQERYWNP